jgi:hypothetical protein
VREVEMERRPKIKKLRFTTYILRLLPCANAASDGYGFAYWNDSIGFDMKMAMAQVKRSLTILFALHMEQQDWDE